MKNRRNPKAIDYFHRKIQDFDDIYRDDKPGLISFLNRTIRASVRLRFDLAFKMIGDISGKSVLDIGCGSGRYMFESIRRGAAKAVGLDAAAGALAMAGKMASDFGVADHVEFIETDFMDFDTDKKFDIVFAVGYFDYIFDPVTHLKKMSGLSNGILYASFPKLWSPLSAIRKIRLALNRCPVRYYSKGRIRKIMREADITNYEIRTIFRDNILIIKN